MELHLRLGRDCTPQERKDVDGLVAIAFGRLAPPDLPVHRLAWAPSDPNTDWWLQVREADQLVSFLMVIQRTISINGRQVRVAGIRGVATNPEYRQRGYSTIAMQHATAFIWQEIRPELVLLLSSEMAVSFYRNRGWQALSGPVFCEQPGGTTNYTESFPQCPAMVLMPEGSPLPAGPVDLCGLPW
jgi:hypothetical protein